MSLSHLASPLRADLMWAASPSLIFKLPEASDGPTVTVKQLGLLHIIADRSLSSLIVSALKSGAFAMASVAVVSLLLRAGVELSDVSRSDAFQQFLRQFVAGILGHNFAREGAGKEGGRELLHLPARLGQPQIKLVGQRKQSLHSPHDFLL